MEATTVVIVVCAVIWFILRVFMWSLKQKMPPSLEEYDFMTRDLGLNSESTPEEVKEAWARFRMMQKNKELVDRLRKEEPTQEEDEHTKQILEIFRGYKK